MCVVLAAILILRQNTEIGVPALNAETVAVAVATTVVVTTMEETATNA